LGESLPNSPLFYDNENLIVKSFGGIATGVRLLRDFVMATEQFLAGASPQDSVICRDWSDTAITKLWITDRVGASMSQHQAILVHRLLMDDTRRLQLGTDWPLFA
jgi:hypothetical protein